MRTDPRRACKNKEERLLWALLHDGIAHPLMALTLFSPMSVWFHDWTSQRAWPRSQPKISRVDIIGTVSFEEATRVGNHLRLNKIPFVIKATPGDGGSVWYDVQRVVM